MYLRHDVEDSYSLPVRLIELVLARHDRAHCWFDALELRSLVVEPDRIQIMCVLQIAHGREGHVNDPVDIVIALLHFCGKYADDFKTEPVQPDMLAYCIASGK